VIKSQMANDPVIFIRQITEWCNLVISSLFFGSILFDFFHLALEHYLTYLKPEGGHDV
jgi:hypothetical protein